MQPHETLSHRQAPVMEASAQGHIEALGSHEQFAAITRQLTDTVYSYRLDIGAVEREGVTGDASHIERTALQVYTTVSELLPARADAGKATLTAKGAVALAQLEADDIFSYTGWAPEYKMSEVLTGLGGGDVTALHTTTDNAAWLQMLKVAADPALGPSNPLVAYWRGKIVDPTTRQAVNVALEKSILDRATRYGQTNRGGSEFYQTIELPEVIARFQRAGRHTMAAHIAMRAGVEPPLPPQQESQTPYERMRDDPLRDVPVAVIAEVRAAAAELGTSDPAKQRRALLLKYRAGQLGTDADASMRLRVADALYSTRKS